MQMINGFVCQTVGDLTYAKQNIDPAHPRDGVIKADGRSEKKAQADKAASAATKTADAPRNDPAVRYGGALSNLNSAPKDGWSAPGQPPQRAGDLLDVVA